MATASENGGGIVDVVVIGAGISGLCAAYDIVKSKTDYKVVVLEAKDRVGGRLDAVSLKTASGTDTFDLGGQWVGSTQKDILALMSEFGLDTYEQWYTGDKLIHLSDGNIKRYWGAYPSVSYLSLLDVYWLNSKVESMCKQVPLDDPKKCPHAEEWDGETLESWIRKNGWTKASKEIFDIAVGAVFGATLSQMSLLYFLHYVNSAGGWSTLVESGMKGSAQEFKIKGGAHQITKMLAEKIGWDNVKLRQVVTSIRQDGDQVQIQTRNGLAYTAKYIIIAIPPTQARRIEFCPPLPLAKRRIQENMVPTHLTKFIVTYSTAFWRASGLSGEIAHSTDSGCCEMQPIGLTMDGTTHNSSPAIVGFVTSYAAARFTNKTEDEKKTTITTCLAKYLGPEALEPLDFVVRDWSTVEWNGGCPVDVMVPGAITNYGDCLSTPCDRIHWAATDISPIWRGYISGAVFTGHRAAKEVMERL